MDEPCGYEDFRDCLIDIEWLTSVTFGFPKRSSRRIFPSTSLPCKNEAMIQALTIGGGVTSSTLLPLIKAP
jgi:hypothetical protein